MRVPVITELTKREAVRAFHANAAAIVARLDMRSADHAEADLAC